MAISKVGNVIRTATDADVIAGPCIIDSVKVNAGSTTSTATITINSIVVYNSGNLTANTASLAEEVGIVVSGDKSAVINLTGTGASITLYLE